MTQPKDMEQLKKEAEVAIRVLCGNKLNQIGELLKFIDQAHRSGRESMRDECVEKVKKEAATYKKVYLSAAFGRALASALKKIKP